MTKAMMMADPADAWRSYKRVKADLLGMLRDAQDEIRLLRQCRAEAQAEDAEVDDIEAAMAQMHRIERLAGYALSSQPDDAAEALADWDDFCGAIGFIAARADGADPVPQIFTLWDLSPRPLRRLA